MGCVWTKRRKFSMLAAQTCFTVQEVAAIYTLFKKLSNSITKDDVISRDELRLGLFGNSKQHNLFADRIFDMFDSKHDGVIEFEEFVKALSVFHPNTPQLEKIQFAFQLYDIQNNTYIRPDEVKQIVIAFLDESDLVFSDDIIESIIHKTLQEVDSKCDGKIDMEEWKEFVIRNPAILRNLTIPYLLDIGNTFPGFVTMPPGKEENGKEY
ncbi:hypothetical protein ACHQM5_011980 [Ranunculus cassubicifolius]